MKNDLLSTTELAELIGVSRVTVFKKIKAGAIKAHKVGRSFVIDKKDVPYILGTLLSKREKEEVTRAVRKTIKEYGKTLELLGKE